MLPTLLNLQDKVNDWLKFAEAKNGVLIGLDEVMIFGVIQAFIADKSPLKEFHYSVCIVVLLITLSLLLALTSFLPKLQLTHFVHGSPCPESDNLLYFGHIAKYSPDLFFIEFSKFFEGNDQELVGEQTQKQYIGQIVMNSQITMRKFGHFNYAVWATACAIIYSVTRFSVYFLPC